MMNVMDINVMTGLMSAASSSKLSQFATGLAKTADSPEAAQTAMGYANMYGAKALTATEQIQEALAESAEARRAEEQYEEAQLAHATAAASAPVTSQTAISLELSQEYMDYAQTGTAADITASTVVSQPSAPVAKSVQASALPIAEPAVQIPKSVSPKQSATPSLRQHAFSLDIKV